MSNYQGRFVPSGIFVQFTNKTLYKNFQVDIEKAHTEVGKLCKELDIGMLVNNAGVSYEHADFYHDLSPQKLDVLVDVNCSALMMITQSFIRQRVEKKRGTI